jgi:hypothetical protein
MRALTVPGFAGAPECVSFIRIVLHGRSSRIVRLRQAGQAA